MGLTFNLGWKWEEYNTVCFSDWKWCKHFPQFMHQYHSSQSGLFIRSWHLSCICDLSLLIGLAAQLAANVGCYFLHLQVASCTVSAMFFYLPDWSFQKPKNGCAFRNLILRSGLTILKAIKEVLEATWDAGNNSPNCYSTKA